mgnify:CR=1 FL=1
MNKKVKKLWVKALRSGKYKQGIGNLRCGDEFCCLGVLCDLHRKLVRKKSVDIWGVSCSAHGYSYYNEDCSLPKLVTEWAGLTGKPNPCINGISLIRYNDKMNYNFNKIADLIEENL